MERSRSISIELIAFLFAVLFLYAAVSKLLDFQKFAVQVNQSPILTGLGGFIPMAVIGVEIVTCLLLYIPRLRLAGLLVSFTLMTIFTTYIVVILTVSPYVPCSCGGVLEHLGWGEHLLFNSAFIVLAVAGILMERKQRAGNAQVKP